MLTGAGPLHCEVATTSAPCPECGLRDVHAVKALCERGQRRPQVQGLCERGRRWPQVQALVPHEAAPAAEQRTARSRPGEVSSGRHSPGIAGHRSAPSARNPAKKKSDCACEELPVGSPRGVSDRLGARGGEGRWRRTAFRGP